MNTLFNLMSRQPALVYKRPDGTTVRRYCPTAEAEEGRPAKAVLSSWIELHEDNCVVFSRTHRSRDWQANTAVLALHLEESHRDQVPLDPCGRWTANDSKAGEPLLQACIVNGCDLPIAYYDNTWCVVEDLADGRRKYRHVDEAFCRLNRGGGDLPIRVGSWQLEVLSGEWPLPAGPFQVELYNGAKAVCNAKAMHHDEKEWRRINSKWHRMTRYPACGMIVYVPEEPPSPTAPQPIKPVVGEVRGKKIQINFVEAEPKADPVMAKWKMVAGYNDLARAGANTRAMRCETPPSEAAEQAMQQPILDATESLPQQALRQLGSAGDWIDAAAYEEMSLAERVVATDRHCKRFSALRTFVSAEVLPRLASDAFADVAVGAHLMEGVLAVLGAAKAAWPRAGPVDLFRAYEAVEPPPGDLLHALLNRMHRESLK